MSHVVLQRGGLGDGDLVWEIKYKLNILNISKHIQTDPWIFLHFVVFMPLEQKHFTKQHKIWNFHNLSTFANIKVF